MAVDRMEWRDELRCTIAAGRKQSRIGGACWRLAQWLSRRASGEQGSALVEMALVTPIILLLMTGMFSVSMVTYQKLELAEAVSAGARYLAVDRGDSDPCATVANVVYGAAPGLSKTKMSLSFVLNGTSYANVATCSGTTAMVAGKTA